MVGRSVKLSWSVFDECALEADHSASQVFLPPSALEKLTRLHIEYPMLFELINGAVGGKVTHAGVLEFTAEEGKAYLPQWV